MHRPTRLKVTDINPHFTCVLCDGYLIDATTIVECLHSFCKTCIVRYLENSKFCPVCDVQVHKTKPLSSIRSDQTLQDIVYKLVPNLYQSEMQKRREFYAEHPKAAAECSSEERGEGADQRFFYAPDEKISLSLHYVGSKDSHTEESEENDKDSPKDWKVRHLNCPAAFMVSHLQKFIRLKYSLPPTYTVEIMYADHVLREDYTLMDIAYIYAWKRAGPMKFYYNVTKYVPKRWLNRNPVLKQSQYAVTDEPNQNVEPTATCPSAEKSSDSKEVPEKMEVDETGSEEVKPISSSKGDEQISAPPNTSTSSSTTDVQEMDTSEPVIVSSSVSTSLSETPVVVSKAQHVTYNTVKVVSSTENNTILSTANGVRLKFIHHPELNPRNRSKKSGGRKGGRSSKYKSTPVHRLARLAPAPYPPQSPVVPATCLTTQPISNLPQIAVGNLVPSVMTSLAPPLVTTLVSTTANNLCNGSRSSPVPVATTFVNHVTTNSVAKHSEIVPTAISNGVDVPQSGASAVSSSAAPSTANESAAASSLFTTVAPLQNGVNNLPPISSDSSSSASGPPRDVAAESPVEQPVLSTASSSISTATPIVSSVQQNKELPVPRPKSVSPVSTVNNPVLPVVVSTHSSVAITPSVPSLVQSSSICAESQKSTEDSDSGKVVTSSPSEMLVVDDASVPPSQQSKDAVSAPKVSESKPVASPPSSKPIDEGVFCNSYSVDKKSDSFEMSVKNSISAEFSDNDDLGCQPDLVVDEQKMDSSDNEDETDAALRKKITAIAEKEDEADGTDDTEADSGRASDISSQARSSCDDDIGSPMPVAATSDADRNVVTSSASSHLPSFSLPVTSAPTPTVSTEESQQRQTKSNKIDHVINNLICRQEKKDNIGALDLSTCTRKPGDAQTSRPKAVANPVLDIKHRQQAYLPAPNKQHTACPPAPKHPTSSLLLHQLTSHHHNILPSQMPVPSKSSHLPFHAAALPFPSPSRAVSSPSALPGRMTPTYSPNPGMLSPVPTAHQMVPGFGPAGLLPYGAPLMNSYAARGNMSSLPPPGRATPSSNHLKSVASPPPSLHAKFPLNSVSHLCKQTPVPNMQHRKSSSDSHHAKSLTSPSSRNSAMSSPGVPSPHSRTSPSMLRVSPHHRSASPAPTPKMTPNSLSPVSSATPTYKPSQPPIPIYKKSDSYKSYSSKFKGTNLTVINPDPNGYRQKIVIKNLDRVNHH